MRRDQYHFIYTHTHITILKTLVVKQVLENSWLQSHQDLFEGKNGNCDNNCLYLSISSTRLPWILAVFKLSYQRTVTNRARWRISRAFLKSYSFAPKFWSPICNCNLNTKNYIQQHSQSSLFFHLVKWLSSINMTRTDTRVLSCQHFTGLLAAARLQHLQ